MCDVIPCVKWYFPVMRHGAKYCLRVTLYSVGRNVFSLGIDVIDVHKTSNNGVTPDSYMRNAGYPCCYVDIDGSSVSLKGLVGDGKNKITSLISVYVLNYCRNYGISISSDGKMQVVSCLISR